MYVAFTPTGSTPDFYARRETASDGSPRYHVLWLDTQNTPHDTGEYHTPNEVADLPEWPAVLWTARHEEEDAHYTYSNAPRAQDDDEPKPPHIYIMPPPSQTYPIAEG